MKPFWVTFYSYKGGVGRSLAVANVAAILATKGRRVVLIDFDLEAPGLDCFAEFRRAAGTAGVVEYVSEFKRTGVAPDLLPFVHRCELPSATRGEMWLMPAGRKDSAYNRLLNRLDWASLYDSGTGAPFFANWKAAINQHFAPDFVIVDSRTGLTEIGGVCTTQFPELVVMLSGLNEQNIAGTAAVAKSIRDADPERVPQIHFVLSPLPYMAVAKGAENLLTERLSAAKQRFGSSEISSIRYFPPAALSEKLFVLEPSLAGQEVVGDYTELADQITTYNRSGFDFLLREVDKAIVTGDTLRAEKVLSLLERDFGGRAETLFIRARLHSIRQEWEEAIAAAEASLKADVRYLDALSFLEEQFGRRGEYGRTADLYQTILEHAERIPAGRIADLQFHRGQALMASGRHREALAAYLTSAQLAHGSENPEDWQLVYVFNVAEAHRRASETIELELWQAVVKTFGETGSIASSELVTQANYWQAVHIAFAVLGQIPAARDALKKARRAAGSIEEFDKIFCVSTYTHVEPKIFLDHNDRMEAALQRGVLWDGMALPL